MVRTVLAGFVGALIVFLWGALAWQVFGLWSDGVRELPGDGAVERVIAEAVGSDGAYYFPGGLDADPEGFTIRHRAGPVGLVTIRTGGAEPFSVRSMVGGFLITLLCAIMMAGVQAYAGSLGGGWLGRAAVGAVIAVFAVSSTYALQWNWFFWPDDYAATLAADGLIGWFVAALVTATVVGRTPDVVLSS